MIVLKEFTVRLAVSTDLTAEQLDLKEASEALADLDLRTQIDKTVKLHVDSRCALDNVIVTTIDGDEGGF